MERPHYFAITSQSQRQSAPKCHIKNGPRFCTLVTLRLQPTVKRLSKVNKAALKIEIDKF